MARESVDKHLQVAGKMIDAKAGIGEKLAALPKIALFYAWWYPTRWLGWGRWPRYSSFGTLARHLRFVERRCRKLARQSFHGMMVYRAKLEHKQAFLFRLVDIINELFAMSASVSRAQSIAGKGGPEGKSAVALADGFCRASSRRVDELFRSLWSNDDRRSYRLALDVLNGEHAWMESLLDRLDQPASTTHATSTTSEVSQIEESVATA